MEIQGNKPHKSLFAKAEDFLYQVYGPAELGGDGGQPEETEPLTPGVHGDFSVEKDSAGHPYLVRRSGE